MNPRFAALFRWPPTRNDLLIGVTAAVVGFALVVQVASQQETGRFPAAREEDLVRILDDLANRGERLRGEIAELERARDRLGGGIDANAAALEEARRRSETLGILAGTRAAKGPGVVVRVTDPQRALRADVLLDLVQELRDAGAEAMQVGAVRVVAASYFVDAAGGVEVDGVVLRAPYVVRVIGEPATLADALGIPGGAADTVAARNGADLAVSQVREVIVDALRVLRAPQYARPSSS